MLKRLLLVLMVLAVSISLQGAAASKSATKSKKSSSPTASKLKPGVYWKFEFFHEGMAGELIKGIKADPNSSNIGASCADEKFNVLPASKCDSGTAGRAFVGPFCNSRDFDKLYEHLLDEIGNYMPAPKYYANDRVVVGGRSAISFFSDDDIPALLKLAKGTPAPSKETAYYAVLADFLATLEADPRRQKWEIPCDLVVTSITEDEDRSGVYHVKIEQQANKVTWKILKKGNAWHLFDENPD